MTNDQPQYGAGNGYQQDQAQAPYGQQPYPQYTQAPRGLSHRSRIWMLPLPMRRMSRHSIHR